MNAAPLSQLDWALSRWRQWQAPAQNAVEKAPEVERSLSGGLSNSCWLVNTGRGRAVVRLNSPWDNYFNVNRYREAVVQRAMARLGIAPAIWYADIGRGVLVSEFIEGEPLAEDAPQSDRYCREVQGLITRMQSLFLPLPRFDYRQHLAHYKVNLHSLGIAIPDELTAAAARLHCDYPQFPGESWPAVLVHHDLMPANIIDTGGGLKVVDWEYAAMGCGALDWQHWRAPALPGDQSWSLYSTLINGYWHLLSQWLMTSAE